MGFRGCTFTTSNFVSDNKEVGSKRLFPIDMNVLLYVYCFVCKLVRALGIKKSRLKTPYSQGEGQFATLTFSSLA